MNTVYDLFLNFQEQAFDFFEWTKQDTIEHIKKIPMVRVDTTTVLDFLYKDVQVSFPFLGEIHNLTEKYDLEKLEYACLFSDGKIAVAVEFSKDGFSIYKSRLLLDDEEEIIRYVSNEEKQKIEYQVVSPDFRMTFFTRREMRVKNFLEREILKAYQNKEHSKLQYLYLEYFDEVEENLKFMKQKLLDSMECSLNQKHFDLYELLLLLTNKNKKMVKK